MKCIAFNRRGTLLAGMFSFLFSSNLVYLHFVFVYIYSLKGVLNGVTKFCRSMGCFFLVDSNNGISRINFPSTKLH